MFFDLVFQLFTLAQWPPCDAGSLDVTPDQFIGIQVGRIARQEVQRQAPFGGGDIVAHLEGFVSRQAVQHQVNGLPASLHHLAQQIDEHVGMERAGVGAEPEPAPGIDRRRRTDRLALARTLDHRRLAAQPPGLAMHGIGPEAGLIPEEHVGTLAPRLAGKGWEDFALPAFDGFRVALIRPLQRLLRRQPELGQQLAHRRHAQVVTELGPDQVRHDGARPQAEVQTVLPRIAAVDPPEHLLLLRRRQAARPPRRRPRTQNFQPGARSQRCLQPLVDRRAIEAVSGNHLRCRLAFADPLHRHHADRFSVL